VREILFLEPVLKEMIWGGSRLRDDFGYDIPSEHTGECWAVSAHPNGDCTVKNGAFKGEKLSNLWQYHKELFGNVKGDVFPLLVKIIDAKSDLSIQVHPDNEYASEKENGALGKTECWYILDCDTDGQIVIGHNAKDKKELGEMIENHKWKELIRVLPIKKGDFFQIEPGTVHAIKAGTLILETQQNSDITYRLYDYDRLSDGKPRELHIHKCIDVITCPHKEFMVDRNIKQLEEAWEEHLITCEYYGVSKLVVTGTQTFLQREPFTLLSVIDGNGSIDGTSIKKGDHFILPAGYGEYTIAGEISLIKSGVGHS
jgi:mannose-6-phosphate isomerase/beta-glucosidase